MQDHLLQVAAREELPFSDRMRTYNSRRAQELGKWADVMGQGDNYRKAVYHAYFVEGKNIAKTDELLLIAESLGLPLDDARKVIKDKSFAAAVDADWRLAHEMRITAVPTHICKGKRLSGFSSYEDYVKLIK